MTIHFKAESSIFSLCQSNQTPIWLKSDLYLRYRIEDLITPHYWSCSLLVILTNHTVTCIHLKISEAWAFWPFDLSILHGKGDTKTLHQNDFRHRQKFCTTFIIRYLIGRNPDAKCKYKFRLNTIRNGELSDPQCDSVL